MQPILYFSWPIHIGGLFKANWAKRESLEPERFCKRSSRDPQIFMIDFAGLEICKYLFAKAEQGLEALLFHLLVLSLAHA